MPDQTSAARPAKPSHVEENATQPAPLVRSYQMIADAAVRLANLSDAAEISAMSREYIEYGLPWSWRPLRVSRSIEDPDTNVVVVEGQDGIASFGIMYYAQDDAHLLLFAVRRTVRRQGVGSAVLRWLEVAARAAGAKRIRVECRRENFAARSFYSEHGYHERAIKTGMYSGVADGIRLEKWLRADALHASHSRFPRVE